MLAETAEHPEADEAASLGVHPGILLPGTFPPFDLFVRAGQEDALQMLLEADQPVYASLQRQLQQMEADQVYLRASDREACLDYVEEHLEAIRGAAGVPARQLAQWIYHLCCRAVGHLLEEPASHERHQRVAELVERLSNAILANPGVEWRMLECAPLKHCTDSHSVNVSVLLVSFAHRVRGIDDPALIRQIAQGGVLHDLGKTQVPPGVLRKPGRLSREEFAQVKLHPERGLGLVPKDVRHGTVARHVIGQHHEDVCGSGYPEGRTGESIHAFARIARIADVFDALTSNRPYSAAMTSYDALNHMVVKMRRKLDVGILRRFIRHLSEEDTRSGSLVPLGANVGEEETGGVQEGAADQTGRAITEGPCLEQPLQGMRIALPDEVSAEERAAALDELMGRSDETGFLVRGIMEALNEAASEASGRSDSTAGRRPADSEPAAEQPAGEAPWDEVGAARRLFPLVWKIDEWRARHAPRSEEDGRAARVRAQMLACFDLLREEIAEVLEGYHVSIIENPEGDDSETDGRERARVQKVGFLYHRGEREEVLEPARVVLHPDRRRAG